VRHGGQTSTSITGNTLTTPSYYRNNLQWSTGVIFRFWRSAEPPVDPRPNRRVNDDLGTHSAQSMAHEDAYPINACGQALELGGAPMCLGFQAPLWSCQRSRRQR